MDTKRQELKDRIDAKRKRVEARILELNADASEKARKRSESLQKDLAEVGKRVGAGYEDLEDNVVDKLNEWLDD